MSNIKEDLSTYKELKKIKSDFSKEIKNTKAYINKKDFSSAKNSLNKCDTYINNMERIIDKMPDKCSADTIRKIIPTLVSLLSTTIMVVKELNLNKKDKSDSNSNKKNVSSNESEKQINDMFDSQFKEFMNQADQINQMTIHNNNMNTHMNNVNNMNIDSFHNNFNNFGESVNIDEPMYEKLTLADATVLSTTGIGSGIVARSIKPLKTKAKNILKKCKKVLDDTKKYLDKVEKMSDAVKESFNETLDDLYESFTEGTIDEFEYDTLIDHLLS